ncbi:MAG: PKD domain-containing protein [Bacteroidia bacterium]
MKKNYSSTHRLLGVLLLAPFFLLSVNAAHAQNPKCAANPVMQIDTITGNLSFFQSPKSDSVNYTWELDGSTVSNQYYYFNNISTPGGHKMCLKARHKTDTTCVTIKCDSFYITYNPNTQCTARFYDSIMGPNHHFFINTSGGNNLTYYWDYGDGTNSTNYYGDKTYTTPGTYNVCLTVFRASDSCTHTTCKTVIIGNTSIKAHPFIDQLNVYPVPFGNTINIDMYSSKKTSATLQFTDIAGRKVHEQLLPITEGKNHSSISLPELPKGIYILRILTEDGLIHRSLVH